MAPPNNSNNANNPPKIEWDSLGDKGDPGVMKPSAESLASLTTPFTPQRDRIVVLGRRQSGKTIFLSAIYAQLWKSVDGLTAKALTGEVHKQLMAVHQLLQSGQWPPSTLATSQIDLELEYHGRRHLLVALDFAGEIFSKAFLDEHSDWPGVKELVSHIDNAAAVLLLVDPSVIAGADTRAAMEDDFGLVQAVQRIRNWPGGDRVPIVLVLTKTDQNQVLLDRMGGPMEFVRKHFPALLRLLKQFPIVQISAVQSDIGSDGKAYPRPDSAPINLTLPLRHCLRELERGERRIEAERVDAARRAAEASARAQAHAVRKRIRRSVHVTVSAIVLAGTTLAGLILYYNI